MPVPRALLVVAYIPVALSSPSIAQTADPFRPRITVGPAVQVSVARQKFRQGEFGVCADATNSKELAVGVVYDNTDDTNSQQYTSVYTSHDAGLSWNLAREIPIAIDPACAFGPNGMLYAVVMASDVPNDWQRVDLHSSADRGKTWSAVSVRPPRGRIFDRPWVTVDNTSGPHAATVYFNAILMDRAWDRDPGVAISPSGDMLVFRSQDLGKSIENPVVIPRTSTNPPPPPIPFGAPGQMVVLSNGTVVTSHVRYGSDPAGGETAQTLALSRDGGKTFAAAFLVSGPANRPPTKPNYPRSGHFMPMVAVDPSNGPYRDRVYVVWTSANTGRRQLWLTYSLDSAAQRWAPARIIDETAATALDSVWLGPHHANPTVAVNAAGVVAISWAARTGPLGRSDGTTGGFSPYQPRFMASIDGGETWSQSVSLTPAPIHDEGDTWDWWASRVPNRDAQKRAWAIELGYQASGEDVSDFWGMVADAAGTFHPMWLDNRTGRRQLWTAPVTVDGRVHRLRDITNEVRLRVGSPTFDSTTRRLSVDLTVIGSSERSLAGPFLVKRIARASSTGGIESKTLATNADNGWQGLGAFWIVPTKDTARPLRNEEPSLSRRLEFSTRARGTDGVSLADRIEFRIFVRED